MSFFNIDIEQNKREIWELAQKLFPIHRTLVNKGYDQSLEIIKKQLAVDILKYPSGARIWDWIIPNEWNVNSAFIENERGEKIVDFEDNNLHLSAYSLPYKGWVSHNELMSHINYIKEKPSAIPYRFLYYNRDWAFNIAYQDLVKFNTNKYYINIDVDEKPGNLKIGEYYIRGKTDKEVLFTTYMCHPSLANDNLSGVLTLVDLFKILSQKKMQLNYSYRLIIVPETIGSICYIYHNLKELQNVIAGYTVYCCGDNGNIHYKKTYSETSYADVIAQYTLKQKRSNYGIKDFWPGGSDERQFNAAGVRLPVGAITRTLPAEFYEYHTSLDTLDTISSDNIFDTVSFLLDIITVIEYDQLYKNNYIVEPCFSQHNIKYPTYNDALEKSSKYNVKILANEIDGQKSLFQIAKKWNIPIEDLKTIIDEFIKEKLIKPVK